MYYIKLRNIKHYPVQYLCIQIFLAEICIREHSYFCYTSIPWRQWHWYYSRFTYLWSLTLHIFAEKKKIDMFYRAGESGSKREWRIIGQTNTWQYSNLQVTLHKYWGEYNIPCRWCNVYTFTNGKGVLQINIKFVPI